MTEKEIRIEIARLPITRVFGAYNRYNASPDIGATKAQCVDWLAKGVVNNLFSLDDVRNTAPYVPPVTNPVGAPVRAIEDQAAREFAKQAETQATSAMKAVSDLALRVSTLSDHLINVESHGAKLAKHVKTVVQRMGEIKIDDRDLQKAVANSIAAEFAPFKQAVIDANAQAIVADLSALHPVGKLQGSHVFGVNVRDARGNDLEFDVWNNPDAPAVDPDFIWDEGILRHLALSDRTGENVWFGGEKGTGKSETARQFAARTNRSFKRINFHKHTSTEEYLGAVGLTNGETTFQAGDFLTAYTTPGTVILLDEPTNADPGELAALNGLLEPNAAVSFGGRIWRRAPGVLVFAADNTFGSGDDTGRYAGTRTQNVALIDRFSRVIPFTFMAADKEIDAIVRRSGCTPELAQHIHGAVLIARSKVEQGEIVDAPSIRSMIAFCRAVQVLDPREAWETTVVARQPSESAATLRGIYEACVNPEIIKINL